jgi:AcrR family transcriptional regulator
MLRCNSWGMGWITTITSLFRQQRITTADEVLQFLETRAAYVAQKSISEYAQARANMMFSSLLTEKDFKAAYELARWQAFAPTLSMVAEVLAGAFRQRLGATAETATAVTEHLAARVIARMAGHGPLDAAQWAGAQAALARDLARAALGAPHAAHAIAQARAREVFDALPFHPAIKQHDFTMFRNTLSFHLTEIATQLEESVLEDGALAVLEKP